MSEFQYHAYWHTASLLIAVILGWVMRLYYERSTRVSKVKKEAIEKKGLYHWNKN